jgi:hypothetical protein
MHEEQKLDHTTASERPPLHYPAPPNSRDPEVLADAIEQHLDGWGLVSFVELAAWLGESFQGNCRLTDARDPNIVFWGNLSPEIVEALNILIQAGRVELRTASHWSNSWNGGISGLPLANKRPPADGYARPHWQPVKLILPKGRSRLNSALCYGTWQ